MSFRERMSGAVSKAETLIDIELSRRKIDKYFRRDYVIFLDTGEICPKEKA